MSNDDSRRRGSLLQVARKKAGLTQSELADRLGVSVKTVHNLERGAFDNPSTLDAAMAVLGVSVEVMEKSLPDAAVTHPELAELRQFPRAIFVPLLVWATMLDSLTPAEQDERIEQVTRYLLGRTDDL